MARPKRKKPRYTRQLFVRRAGRNRRYGRGFSIPFPKMRCEFYRAGYSTIRLPGLPFSSEFMATYQIALTCQIPIRPAKCDRMLALRISINANLLLLTPAFGRLNAFTRNRYRYLLEDFCSRIAGRRVSLDTHYRTALFIHRMRPHVARRRIAGLRKLIAAAGRLTLHPSLGPEPVRLTEWAADRSRQKSAAKAARIAARQFQYYIKTARRDAKLAAYRRMVERGRLLAPQPVSPRIRKEVRKIIDQHRARLNLPPLDWKAKGSHAGRI